MNLRKNDIVNVFGQKPKQKTPETGYRRDRKDEFLSEDKSSQMDGDGTWIYSFADLVMNLLMFFVMMFAISSVDFTKLNVIKKAISSHIDTEADKKAAQTKVAEGAPGALAGGTSLRQKTIPKILDKAENLLKEIDQKQLLKEKENHDRFLALDAEIKRVKDLQQEIEVSNPAKDTIEMIFPRERIFNAKNGISREGHHTLINLAKDLEARKISLNITAEVHISREHEVQLGKRRGWDASLFTSWQAAAIVAKLKEGGLSVRHKLATAGMGTLIPFRGENGHPLDERVVLRVARVAEPPKPTQTREIVR